jgi:Protein of unknown function (DUF3606)
MGRLVVLLVAFLGWAALTRKGRPRRLFGSRPDAFEFPTSRSHAGIDLEDPKATAEWCEELGCSEEQLRAAVKAMGRSAAAVRQHLARRR